MNILCSWSGGKDSSYALQKVLANKNYTLKALLNMMNENGQISRSHAIPKHILQQQATALNVPLTTIASTWDDYEENYIKALQQIKTTHAIDAVVFGDIDIIQHREWEEKVCKAASLNALLPLWQQDRRSLVEQMIDEDIDATIVSCNTSMGIEYLGKKITKSLIQELEKLNMDACGENGEFHTLVTNCSLFSNPIKVQFGEKRIVNNYCFIEMN